MRRLVIAAALGLLSGCVAAPPEALPTLVVDVRNASDRHVPITYEFEGTNSVGSGELTGTACWHQSLSAGPIEGAYSLSVDGEVVLEGEVPPRAGRGTVVIVGVWIDREGELEIRPPGVALTQPSNDAEVPGCG